MNQLDKLLEEHLEIINESMRSPKYTDKVSTKTIKLIEELKEKTIVNPSIITYKYLLCNGCLEDKELNYIDKKKTQILIDIGKENFILNFIFMSQNIVDEATKDFIERNKLFPFYYFGDGDSLWISLRSKRIYEYFHETSNHFNQNYSYISIQDFLKKRMKG